MSSRSGRIPAASPPATSGERAARDVQGLVEVVRGRLGSAVGPQELGRALAVDAPIRRKRQQLDEALPLAQPPRPLGHDLVADTRLEGAEQSDLEGLVHLRPCLGSLPAAAHATWGARPLMRGP